MATKPPGIVLTTPKQADGSFPINNVKQKSCSAENVDSTTILLTVTFEISGAELHTRDFEYTPTDKTSYIAFQGKPEDKKIEVVGIEPCIIKQTEGDPVIVTIPFKVKSGKVGGAG